MAGGDVRCQVAVVGRGLLGSAAARHLADLGADVVLIGPGEPADPSTHDGVHGSHYDSSRITRVLDRDPFFARLAAASLARHRELEDRTGIDFYRPVGHLAVSGMNEYLAQMLENAAAHGVGIDQLDAAQLRERFPALSFASDLSGVHDPAVGGHIDPRRFIAASSKSVELQGGTIINATVVAVEPESDGVTVGLDDGSTVAADKVLLVTGAFANHLGIIPKEIEFGIEAHTFLFAEIDEPTAERLAGLPTVIYKRGDGVGQSVYFLPPVRYPDGRSYLKIGQSVADRMADPSTELIPWCQSPGDPAIAAWLERELLDLVPGVESVSVRTGASIVTKSPTHRQFIDQFPDCEVYALLADDGHVAKSADELGRMGAHRVLYGAVPEEYRDDDFSLVFR